MRVGNRSGVLRWVVAAVVLGAAGVAAQQGMKSAEPSPLKLSAPLPATPAAVPLLDPGIEPVQRLEAPIKPVPGSVPDSPNGPSVATGVTSTPARGGTPITDPPPAVVQLQLRTPAHVAVGKPVPYRVTVGNTSQASAHKVKVRVPMPDGVAALVKADPPPDGAQAVPKEGLAAAEFTWSFKTLGKGDQKQIDLEFSPKPGEAQVQARAYVSFEYGAAVVTVVDKPKLTVKKTATPQAATTELVTVRVDVTNPSPVPVPKVRLVETAPAGVEYVGDAAAERTKEDGQRQWELDTLAAGQTKTVTYQLRAKQGMELNSTSVASSPDAQVQSEVVSSKTKVLVAGVQLGFDGPKEAKAGVPAVYTATAGNTGTLPLTNVQLALDVPSDCAVSKATTGSRRTKDTVLWVIPTLKPGENVEKKLTLEPEATASGPRTVKASLRDPRERFEPQTKDITTAFQGRAAVTWAPRFEQTAVNVDQQGTITVAVTNEGSQTDDKVRLKVTLPKEVSRVEESPQGAQLVNNDLTFPPQAVRPGQTVKFSVTYKATQAGQAKFRVTLDADSLGNRPLEKVQSVEIGGAR